MVDEQDNNNNKREIERLLQSVQPGILLQEQESIKAQLKEAVNYLIVHHFEKLVQLLYTVDIDEKRLKSLLGQKPDVEAAQIIADLLLERQLQKAALRQRYSKGKPTDEEESW